MGAAAATDSRQESPRRCLRASCVPTRMAAAVLVCAVCCLCLARGDAAPPANARACARGRAPARAPAAMHNGKGRRRRARGGAGNMVVAWTNASLLDQVQRGGGEGWGEPCCRNITLPPGMCPCARMSWRASAPESVTCSWHACEKASGCGTGGSCPPGCGGKSSRRPSLRSLRLPPATSTCADWATSAGCAHAGA